MKIKLQRQNLLPTLLLVFTGMIWGSGFLASRVALDSNFSPGFVLAVRFLLATLCFLLFCGKHIFPLSKKQVKSGLIIGTCLFAAYYLQIIGMLYTNPANTGFLTSTSVVMVPFVTWIWSKKRPSGLMVFACLLCTVGIGVLNFKGQLGFSFNLGDLLTLFCALCFALHIAAIGVFAKEVDVIRLTFMQFAWAACLSVLAFWAFDRHDFSAVAWAQGLPALVYLGLIITCLGFFIQVYAQTKVSAAKTAVILSTEGFWCMVFSVFLGYEALSLPVFLGGILIIIAVVLAELDFSPAQKEEYAPNL